MPEVFLSYSRRDSQFVTRFARALEDAGKDVWVDIGGIEDAEVFPEAIRRAIEGSDAFVFVISPHSATSQYCGQEVDHAHDLGKRIVPVLHRPIGDDAIHPEIRDRNWIGLTAESDFDAGVVRVVAAVDRDLDHARAHTHWTTRALEWDGSGRDATHLPRSGALTQLETWLASCSDASEPVPTELQRAYALAGRQAATRRQRLLLGAAGIVTAISLALLVFALISRSAAVSQRTTARSSALAARSDAARTTDPLRALELARRGVRTRATATSLRSLKQSLDALPLALSTPRLPALSSPACVGQGLGLRPRGGEQLALAGCDGLMRLVDARSGGDARRIRVAPHGAAVAWSPNGASLAVLVGRAVQILDPESGRVVRRYAVPRAPRSSTGNDLDGEIAFSPDGRQLAAVLQTVAFVVDLPRGRTRVLARDDRGFGNFAYTRDGRRLILGRVSGADVFDASSGKRERRLALAQPARYTFPSYVATNTTNDRIALSRYDMAEQGVIQLYDGRSWRLDRVIVTAEVDWVNALAMSPDGTRVASSAAGGVSVWSSVNGRELVRISARDIVKDLDFSPASDRLAFATLSGETGIMRAQGPERLYLQATPSVIDGVALSTTVVAAAPRREAGTVVERWRARDGRPLPDLVVSRRGARVRAFSISGRLLYETADGERAKPAIWDLVSGRIVRRLPAAQASGLTASDDDRVISILEGGGSYRTSNKRVTVIDVRSGRTRRIEAARGMQAGCSLTQHNLDRHGRRLVVANPCGDVAMYDTGSGRRLSRFTEKISLATAAPSPQGDRIVIASYNGEAFVRNASGRGGKVQLVGHQNGLGGASWTPDGRRIVTISYDRTVRVWDPDTGRLLRTIPLPSVPTAFTMTRRGGLAIGDARGAIRVMDVCADCEDAKRLLRRAQTFAR